MEYVETETNFVLSHYVTKFLTQKGIYKVLITIILQIPSCVLFIHFNEHFFGIKKLKYHKLIKKKKTEIYL